MLIKKFLRDYNDKYFRMKDKLLELKEAERRFVELSGMRLSDLPKNKKSNNTYDYINQIANIEKLNEQYQKLEKECLILRDEAMQTIDKIEKPIYRTMIILAFLEHKRDKEISTYLNKIYKLNYSEGYIRQLKSKAIRLCERILKED